MATDRLSVHCGLYMRHSRLHRYNCSIACSSEIPTPAPRLILVALMRHEQFVLVPTLSSAYAERPTWRCQSSLINTNKRRPPDEQHSLSIFQQLRRRCVATLQGPPGRGSAHSSSVGGQNDAKWD